MTNPQPIRMTLKGRIGFFMRVSKSPKNKNVTESDLHSLQDLIGSKPDPVHTSMPVIGKWMASAWGFFKRGSHECFLAAWHVGEILAAIRSRCPHGNKKDRTGPTFEEWVEQCCPFDIRTAERWSDLFAFVKRENVTEFDNLTIGAALEIALTKKAMLRDERDRSEKRSTAKEKKRTQTPEKQKPVKPIGNYVSQIKSSALGLRDAVEVYASSDTRSTSIECDKLETFIADLLQSVELSIFAAEKISSLREKLTGNKHSKSSRAVEVCKKFHREFLKLSEVA